MEPSISGDNLARQSGICWCRQSRISQTPICQPTPEMLAAIPLSGILNLLVTNRAPRCSQVVGVPCLTPSMANLAGCPAAAAGASTNPRAAAAGASTNPRAAAAGASTNPRAAAAGASSDAGSAVPPNDKYAGPFGTGVLRVGVCPTAARQPGPQQPCLPRYPHPGLQTSCLQSGLQP
jgi:hypothetical protein